MPKKLTKERKRCSQKAFIVKLVADKHKINPKSVYRILNADRSNEAVFGDYMELYEKSNLLLTAVNQLVPFN